MDIELSNELKKFVCLLFDKNIIKFGSFKLKSGVASPIYVDLRSLVSFPYLMKTTAALISDEVQDDVDVELLCGIPYTALPVATLVSSNSNLPMIIVRKEKKEYGTAKLIEGTFRAGQNCLLIDDVVSTGSSLASVKEKLVASGLEVTKATILIDRETGGKEILAEKYGIAVRSLLTLSSVCKTLVDFGKIPQETANAVIAFTQKTKMNTLAGDLPEFNFSPNSYFRMSYADRSAKAEHPMAVRLFGIMDVKKTNLAVACDLDDADMILQVANELGPLICCLKVHCDVIMNFSEKFVRELVYFSSRFAGFMAVCMLGWVRRCFF